MEEEAQKKSSAKKILLILISIMVVSIIISTIYLYATYDKGEIKEAVKSIIDTITGKEPEETPPEQYLEEESSSGGGSGGGGSGGGSSSGGGTVMPNGCTRYFISYSITDINKLENCTSYSGETCTEKTVNCSATVRNRDDYLEGYFRIEILLMDELALGSSTFDLVIPSNKNSFVSEEFSIYGENATKETSCYFRTLEEPYKEIC